MTASPASATQPSHPVLLTAETLEGLVTLSIRPAGRQPAGRRIGESSYAGASTPSTWDGQERREVLESAHLVILDRRQGTLQ